MTLFNRISSTFYIYWANPNFDTSLTISVPASSVGVNLQKDYPLTSNRYTPPNTSITFDKQDFL